MPRLDIHSSDSRTHMLSNFYPHAFTMDTIAYASMEAFLQCLKFPPGSHLDEWAKCTQLSGFAAKKFGQTAPDWRKRGVLHYGNAEIDRQSQDYQDLLDRAYIFLYDQNEDFRSALKATRGYELEHTIGKRVTRQTVLTEEEFVTRLMKLREHGDK